MIALDALEEFSGHFDKVALENRLLEIEGAISGNTSTKSEVVQALFRDIHSLKGTSGMLKLDRISQFLHVYEDALAIVSKGIHQIVAVKDVGAFDFFLQGLDLIERLSRHYAERPKLVLKDQPEIFRTYIGLLLAARRMMEHSEEYFVFTALDEGLF